MRSADMVSLLRLPLLAFLVYLVLIRFNPVVVVLVLFFLFISDAFDGYFATLGKHTLPDFLGYFWNEAMGRKKTKKFPKKMPKYAAYLDIAIDRIIDYTLWGLFTLLGLLPLIVIVVVFIRNTISDFLVVRSGKTFAKMHSAFGRIASSHIIRGANSALKAINFAFLALVFIAGWPIAIAYVLTAITVALILLRGAAEIYEALLH